MTPTHLTALAAALAFAGLATSAPAATVVALKDGKSLVWIDTDKKRVTGTVKLDGGAALVGMDVRPSDGKLYGLTLASPIGEAIDVSVTGYYEDKQGYGVSPEAYATSLGNYNAQRLIVPGLTAPKGIQYGLSTVDGTRKGVNGRGASGALGGSGSPTGLHVATSRSAPPRR